MVVSICVTGGTVASDVPSTSGDNEEPLRRGRKAFSSHLSKMAMIGSEVSEIIVVFLFGGVIEL